MILFTIKIKNPYKEERIEKNVTKQLSAILKVKWKNEISKLENHLKNFVTSKGEDFEGVL